VHAVNVKQSQDDVLRLRKELMRLLCTMLPFKETSQQQQQHQQLNGGSARADESFTASILPAIHEAVQLLLSRRVPHAPHPEEADQHRAAAPVRRHTDDEEEDRNRNHHVNEEEEDCKDTSSPSSSSGPRRSSAIMGRLEECAALAYFFALQAQREQRVGAEKVVGEYIRAIDALSAFCFSPPSSASTSSPTLSTADSLFREPWQWDRQRRRCLPWMRKALYASPFPQIPPRKSRE
jgi:hypothetical protein